MGLKPTLYNRQRTNILQLTWLGAAGFRVETDEGAIFLLDPFLSRPAAATPTLPIHLTDLFPVDEIFLTNGRFDHAMDTPALVEQTGAIVHAATSVCHNLARFKVSPNSLQPVQLDQEKRIGTLRWQALPGQVSQVDSSPALRALTRDDVSVADINALDQRWPLGEMITYLFQTEKLSMLYFGSAGWVEAVIHEQQPDIVLLPVESPPMPHDHAAQLANLLHPKIIIPHHWDNSYPPLSETIDLNLFEAIIHTSLPQTRVYRPEIGRPFYVDDLLRQ